MRRDEVDTPALIVDLDILDQNIATMAAWARRQGVSLRPHAKSHKSPEIAKRLIAAGALGASCATIGEAEALADARVRGILITSPIATISCLGRLRTRLADGSDITVVADDPGNARALAEVAASSGTSLPVIVELDVGQGRTGCVEIESAVALAKQITDAATLSFAGVQAYWGHLQQVKSLDERRRLVGIQAMKLRELLDRLEDDGMGGRIVTGGGTGTHGLDAECRAFTELQPGSYIFLDSCYASLPITAEGNPFRPSLFVAASVVSANRTGRMIVNAGIKAFATDAGVPIALRGAPEGATYRFMGDEHGAVESQGWRAPAGAVIEFLTSHCDPTVNLFARYVAVRGEEIVDVWPIVGRGY